MSLYEITSMNVALEEMDKKTGESVPMSDQEFDALKEAVKAMNLPDVRIH